MPSRPFFKLKKISNQKTEKFDQKKHLEEIWKNRSTTPKLFETSASTPETRKTSPTLKPTDTKRRLNKKITRRTLQTKFFDHRWWNRSLVVVFKMVAPKTWPENRAKVILRYLKIRELFKFMQFKKLNRTKKPYKLRHKFKHRRRFGSSISVSGSIFLDPRISASVSKMFKRSKRTKKFE